MYSVRDRPAARTLAAALIGLGAAFVLLAASISFLASAASAHDNSRRVYYKPSSDRAKIEPGRMKIETGTEKLRTRRMSWEHWGSRRTHGSGVILFNRCRPDCASGHYRPAHGNVTLSRVRDCGQRLQYLRLRVDIELASNQFEGFRESLDCSGHVSL